MRQIEYGPDGSAGSLRIAQAPKPSPGPGEVLIAVQFAGVNRPDIHQRQGKYPPPPGASPVLGLEVSGVIAEVGEDIREWKVGDRVCALVPGGGYAEFCVTPARQVLAVPGSMSMAEAAALPENWFTVWANLIEMAALRPGERLLIHGGSSGIGLAALQLAHYLGVEALVTVGSADKANFCLQFGARFAIDYRREDFVERVRELTGEGVDVVLDMVGGSYIPRNLKVLRRDGRLVFIAFLQGSRCDVDFTPIMSKRLRVMGSTMRPRTVEEKARIRDALARDIWPELASGRLRTHVDARFALEQAAQAHELMESGQHIGKILLEVL